LASPPDSPAQRNTDQRLADLAKFANGIAHDLRNPLNVIRSNLYLLRGRIPDDDSKALRMVERIDDQVTAALRLLEGVQAFHRADHPQVQRVNLNEVVRSVADSIVLPEGYELRVEVEEALPLIAADPHLLDAALRALIRNAVEAVAGEGLIRLLTCRGNGSVRLVVEDGGPGIPEDVLPRVFEPLYSTRRSRAGLGLTLVEKVARAHGGRASLASAPGSGTRVTLELPLEGPS
jgi:signal transduction histidine kinase